MIQSVLLFLLTENIMVKLKNYIGDKSFYRKVLTVFLPIVIQMGITNFVNLLDNIMVGSLGEEAMSGVSVVNQFVFIFNLLVFGSLSAAGIFTAQYHGNGDVDGVRRTFRFKLVATMIIGAVCTAVYALFSDGFINMFLHESASEVDINLTFSLSKTYLKYTLIGLIPYAVTQVYASTLKETGNAVAPMICSIIAVATNFVFNLLLIFGLLGFPRLGVAGAAIATVISRFLELFTIVIWVHVKREKFPFIKGLYRRFTIPKELATKIIIKGIPLLTNEFLWSLAMTYRNQCYSTRGLDVLAATSISSTVSNLFAVVYLAMGNSVAIIIGNMLGSGEVEKAKEDSKRLLAFSVAVSALFGVILASFSPLFPYMYDVSGEVRALATFFLIVTSVMMPIYAFSNSAYFTIRSGGKVIITMLLDCVFMWSVVVPFTVSLTNLTDMSITLLYPLCQGIELLKAVFGAILLSKYNWARRIIKDKDKLKISE